MEIEKHRRKNYYRKRPVRRSNPEKAVVTHDGNRKAGYQKHMSLLVQEKPETRINVIQCLTLFLQMTAGMLFVVTISLLFIFLHDLFTQCDYFKATSIAIEGIRRVSEDEVAQRTRISPGVNILSVNLSKARRELKAHPWIDEAEVGRELPSKIHIKITEHEPLAILALSRCRKPEYLEDKKGIISNWQQEAFTTDDMESGPTDSGCELRYLIDAHGEIFKKWTSDDPDDLPVITGLGFSDIPVSESPSERDRSETLPYQAIMHVLHIGRRPSCVIPNRSIQTIEVDREMGITLKLVQQPKRARRVKLGYHNYPAKYERLRALLFYLEKKRKHDNIDIIDLNNLNRVVVSED